MRGKINSIKTYQLVDILPWLTAKMGEVIARGGVCGGKYIQPVAYKHKIIIILIIISN